MVHQGVITFLLQIHPVNITVLWEFQKPTGQHLHHHQKRKRLSPSKWSSLDRVVQPHPPYLPKQINLWFTNLPTILPHLQQGPNLSENEEHLSALGERLLVLKSRYLAQTGWLMQRSQVHSRESDGVPDLGIAQWHEVVKMGNLLMNYDSDVGQCCKGCLYSSNVSNMGGLFKQQIGTWLISCVSVFFNFILLIL